MIDGLARCFHDYRVQHLVEHSVPDLLHQRIFAIAMGYPQLNDHDTLHCDPMMAIGVGKTDPLGLERDAGCLGHALAGKSTLNRLGLTNAKTSAAEVINRGAHNIAAVLAAVENLLIEFGVSQLVADTEEPSRSGDRLSARQPRRGEAKPNQIVLHFDANDNLPHGEQEGKFPHGHYDAYCFLTQRSVAGVGAAAHQQARRQGRYG